MEFSHTPSAMAPTHGSCIVVCGHLCLDIIPGFLPDTAKDWSRPGRLSIMDAAVISTGGAVSNVGLSLDRLGLPVRLIAKLGNDPLARLIVDKLGGRQAEKAHGVHCVEGEVTSYTVVLNPPGIDRILLHCPGANDTFTESDVDDAQLHDARIFHFGYPPLMKQIYSDGGERLERLLKRARQAGALTSLDLSLPDPASPSGRVDWQAYLGRVLPSVDLFEPSVEELLFMTERPLFTRLSVGGGEAIIKGVVFSELRRVAGEALTTGVRAVLIKLGDRGAYLRTGPDGLPDAPSWSNRELYSPVFNVPRVVGTAGAGDSTISGFLASVFMALPPEDALTMAVAVGGCCVESLDTVSGVRSWAETRGRVAAGWARAPVTVTEEGWSRLPGGIWKGPADRS
jgi:sugar/nucleoside kinase (ribokinase family)